MKAIKTTIAILASILAFNAIAQSDDSVSATMGAGTSLSTTGVWTNPMDTYSSTMDSKILSNNSLINAELAKRDALLTSQSQLITDLQNELNKLKTSGSMSNPCPAVNTGTQYGTVQQIIVTGLVGSCTHGSGGTSNCQTYGKALQCDYPSWYKTWYSEHYGSDN
jgi:hypothetical protein